MKAGHIHTGPTRLLPWSFGVLLCWLVLSGSARAVDRFDVFLGYDTYVPEYSWFPIVCEIENKGPVFSGFVEVSVGAFNEGTKRLVPIELPTGTTKRVTIPVFYDRTYGSGWSVRLLDSRGRVKDKRPNIPVRRQIKVESVLLGSISRNDAWSPPLQKLKLRQNDLEPATARILPAILPENPIALTGLDALYLNSERVTSLRQGQRNAIEQWVRTGGHLIVGIESISDVNSSPWLRELVPARLTGVVTVQAHPELQQWIRSSVANGNREPTQLESPFLEVSEPTPDRPFADRKDDLKFETSDIQAVIAEPVGGRVLVASGPHPLIIQGGHGLGRVTVLAFSPEREPFRSWENLPAMWSRLIGVPPEWYVSSDQQNYGRWAADGIFGAMIDSRQIRKLPVGWLLLLLVTYLVVIGPFDRWWLKKIGKPMLTWITFPLYVVLFSGLIYLIGYKLRAGEREWNELHVVDVFSGGASTDLHGRTYGSLYSPVNHTYRLEAPERVAALRGEAANAWGGGSVAEKMDVIQRDDRFECETYVPVWTSQLYVNDWWTAGNSPLQVRLSPSRDGVLCRVENKGDQDLSALRLVLRGEVYVLGDLAAGETKQQSLTTQQGRSLSQVLVEMGAPSYQGIVSQRGQAFGGTTSGRINDLATGCFVASFLGAMEDQSGHSMFVASPGTELTGSLRDNAILLALAKGDAAVPRMNQFRASRGQVNTFWRVAIPLTPKR